MKVTRNGYVRVKESRGSTTFEVYEHRAVAEEILGELAPWEVVHHINGRRWDNRPENLCVMDSGAHEHYHKWFRWMKETFGRYPSRRDQITKLVLDYDGQILGGVCRPIYVRC